eukprot:984791-Pelagomonas_calceolata.AAC.3
MGRVAPFSVCGTFLAKARGHLKSSAGVQWRLCAGSASFIAQLCHRMRQMAHCICSRIVSMRHMDGRALHHKHDLKMLHHGMTQK